MLLLIVLSRPRGICLCSEGTARTTLKLEAVNEPQQHPYLQWIYPCINRCCHGCVFLLLLLLLTAIHGWMDGGSLVCCCFVFGWTTDNDQVFFKFDLLPDDEELFSLFLLPAGWAGRRWFLPNFFHLVVLRGKGGVFFSFLVVRTDLRRIRIRG